MSLISDIGSGIVSSVTSGVTSFANNTVNSLFSNINYLNGFGINIRNGNIFNFEDKNQSEFEEKAGDLSFKNRFDFMFILPSMMKSSSAYEINDILRIFCRQFPVPSTSTEITEDTIMNRKVTGTSKLGFDTLNVTFMDTKALTLHKFFNKWNMEKWDKNRGSMKYYPNEYKTDVIITNYNDKVYLIRGIHPINVGDIVFSHDSVDEILTFDVTLNVDSIEPIASDGSSIIDGIEFVEPFNALGRNILGNVQSYFVTKINTFLSGTRTSITSGISNLFR